jgi:hypothetical protein
MSWFSAAPWRGCFRAFFLAAAASALLGLAELPPRATPASLPVLRALATPDVRDWVGSPAEEREKIFMRLGVDGWHKAGQRGRGIKIAVLDAGFRDYRSHLGKALPAQVMVRSFRKDGNLEARESQHGILCGEVIHALAPEAELLFVNWEPDQPETFLEAASWAKEHGAKVLSCSLIMPSWSDGEGGGRINAALARIVGGGRDASDVLCFASAGNLAQRHWCGAVNCDAAGFHQWQAGQRNNPLTAWGTERVSVELYGRACKDLELLVYECGTGQQVGRCLAVTQVNPSGCAVAVVRFLPQPCNHYFVRVRCSKVPESDNGDPFHLVVLGGGLSYTTSCGSIPCPADGAGVLAVGAVDSEGRRWSYSSCGPNSRLPKPDFVAEVPFPSLCRDRPFGGTSAAAPQAAALAALVWGRHANWTADQVRQCLQRASRDLGPLGHDWETGHGLLMLPGLPSK